MDGLKRGMVVRDTGGPNHRSGRAQGTSDAIFNVLGDRIDGKRARREPMNACRSIAGHLGVNDVEPAYRDAGTGGQGRRLARTICPGW